MSFSELEKNSNLTATVLTFALRYLNRLHVDLISHQTSYEVPLF